MKFNHIGIPTTDAFDGEIELPSTSHGVLVAFIVVNGAPVERMEIDHLARPDL